MLRHHPMRLLLRLLSRFAILIVAVLLLAAGLAWYAVGTRHGSRLISSKILARAVTAQRLSVGHIDGTLWGGLAVRAVEIDGLKGLPPGSRLRIQGVDTAPLSGLTAGRPLKLAAHHARLWIPQPGVTISVNLIQGGLTGDWALQDVSIGGLPRLASASAPMIQEIAVSVPISARGVKAVRNGKIPLQYSEPVVFSGSQQAGRLDARVYSRTLDVQEVLELIGVKLMGDVQGTVTDVNLRVSGPLRHPLVSGEFRVVRLLRKGFAMLDCPGAATLRLRGWRYDAKAKQLIVDVEGDLELWTGTLATKNTMIRLETSRLRFDGELRDPSYDVRGVAVVDGTRIHMTLKGTKRRPELRLRSEPSKPQERLLLMLATGKSWKGADLLLTGSQIPVDLVQEFVDFVFFAGGGTRLAHRLGISDISLVVDPQQRGVGVGTVLFDRVEAGYEIRQPPPEDPVSADGASAVPATTHKIGAGYKLSTDSSISIEGEKTVEPRATLPAPSAESAPAQLDDELFDKILLKYKRKF